MIYSLIIECNVELVQYIEITITYKSVDIKKFSSELKGKLISGMKGDFEERVNIYNGLVS